MKVLSISSSHRAALMLGCSVIALAATAGVRASAQQVTAGYSYNVSSTPGSNTVTSPSSVELLPSAGDGQGNSVFGHDYGTVGGLFGTRSSGTGVYSISGFSDYQVSLTNTTATASDYSLTYVLQNGQVNIGAPVGTSRVASANATAVLTATYGPSLTTTLLNYAVSLNYDSTVSQTPTFSESGLVLNPAGPTLAANSGDYSWTTFTGTVDLGVLAPGASAAIDYRLDSSATGSLPTVFLSTSASTLDVVVGYGGAGSSDGSVARFGDPFDGTGSPVPFVIVASAVPEPASLAVLGAGLAALALGRRRRSPTEV